MDIRKDLHQVEGLISRLLSIGKEFQEMDSRWSHMKNNEDFERIHDIKDLSKKHKIEDVYGIGRDMALFMSEALLTINSDFSTYPTLTSIINRFNDTWIDQDLSNVVPEAKKAQKELEFRSWALQQMYGMFEEQLKLNKAVKQTLNLLKESDLYKQENGLDIMSEDIPQGKATINGAKITAIAVIIAAIIGGVFMLITKDTNNVTIKARDNATIVTGDDNLIDKK